MHPGMSPTEIVWYYFSAYQPRMIGFVLGSVFAVFMAWKYRDALFGKLCRYIVIPFLILLAGMVNPRIAAGLVRRDINRTSRFFWLIPAGLLIAIVVVWLITRLPARRQKLAVVLTVPFLLLLFSKNAGTFFSVYENRFTNWYKIPEVVVQLDDWIMNDDSGLEKTAVFPWPLLLWTRQYRAEIAMPFSWINFDKNHDAAVGLHDIFKRTIQTTPDAEIAPIDLDQVDALAVAGGYNYLVLDPARKYTGALKSFEEVLRIDTDPAQDTTDYDREYILYRLAGTR